MGKRSVAYFSSAIHDHPTMLPQMLCSWDQSQSKPQQVIISGQPGSEDTEIMLSTVFSAYEPGRVVLLAENGPNEVFLARYLPFVGDMDMIDEKATAYVCQDFTCEMPVNTIAQLKNLLSNNSVETPAK